MAVEKKEREREPVNREWIEPLDTDLSFSELTRAIMRAPLRDVEAAERESQR